MPKINDLPELEFENPIPELNFDNNLPELDFDTDTQGLGARQEDIVQRTPGVFGALKNISRTVTDVNRNILKGVASGTENFLASVGDTAFRLGENLKTTGGKIASRLPGNPLAALNRKQIDKLADKLIAVGKDFSEFMSEQANTGWEAPDPELMRGDFLDNPSWQRASFLVGGAIPSLAGAAAITMATKNPWMGAMALGLSESSGSYKRMRDAGTPQLKASALADVSTVANTILEEIPLSGFLKRSGKGIVTRAVKGAIQEGTEEAAQQIATNIIEKIGYDKTRKFYDGIVDSIVAGAISGGVVGGSSRTSIDNIQNIKKELVEKGVPEQQTNQLIEGVGNHIKNNAGEIETKIEDKSKEQTGLKRTKGTSTMPIIPEKTPKEGGLEQEAKGKTLEEFVSNTGIRSTSQVPQFDDYSGQKKFDIPKDDNEIQLYHGTSVGDYNKIKKIPLEKATMDRIYGDYFYATNKIEETTVYGNRVATFNLPKNKVLEYKEFQKLVKGKTETEIDEFVESKFKEGYWAIGMPDNEFIIKNIETVRDYTKSQLTDIWKKENAKEGGLEQEAKGKSLEEFVASQKAGVLNTEDLELNPDKAKKQNIVGAAFIQDGKVYGDKYAEGAMNHSDIAEKYKLDYKKAVPGFIDKDGNFLYQYEEDLPVPQLTDIWKKANVKESVSPKQSLEEEAKKYKSAEEFVKAFDEGQAGVGSHVPYAPFKRLLEMNTGKDTLVEAGMNPDDMITVYRGVDDKNREVSKTIQAGDYVATSRELARSYVGDDANIVSMKIKAKDFYTELYDGINEDIASKGIDSIHLEGVYNPNKPITNKQLTDIWKKENAKESGLEQEAKGKSFQIKGIGGKDVISNRKLREDEKGIAGQYTKTGEGASIEQRQATNLIKNKLKEQTVVTISDAKLWLKDRGLLPKGEYSPSEQIKKTIENSDFKKLNVFDRIRVAAQLERGLKNDEYTDTPHSFGNEKLGGSQIIAGDTVRGCDNYCFECFANKNSRAKDHSKTVPTDLSNINLQEKDIFRAGTVGDPALDWDHTNKQISDLLKRAQDKGKNVSAEKNIFYVTKLQDIKGFNPSTVKNMEVSLDPFYPAHLSKSIGNILKIKDMYPKTNISVRIRTYKSLNGDLKAALDVAKDFAEKFKLNVLETRMRFQKKVSAEVLQLDLSKYNYDGSQYKLKKPVFDAKKKNVHTCDESNTGKCQACMNCTKLMIDNRNKNLLGQNPKFSDFWKQERVSHQIRKKTEAQKQIEKKIGLKPRPTPRVTSEKKIKFLLAEKELALKIEEKKAIARAVKIEKIKAKKELYRQKVKADKTLEKKVGFAERKGARLAKKEARETFKVLQAIKRTPIEGMNYQEREAIEVLKTKLKDTKTLAGLKELYFKINQSKELGKEKFQRVVNLKNQKFELNKKILVDTIGLVSEEKVAKTKANEKKESLKGYKGKRAMTLTLNRIFDALDGGVAFEGVNNQFFYNRANLAEDYKKTMSDGRHESMDKYRESLGISLKDLAVKKKIGKNEYTLDEQLSVYVGLKNNEKKLALQYGNNYPIEEMNSIVEQMSVNEKKLGDAILKDYADNYERLRSAFITYNDGKYDLGKVLGGYSPILRLIAGRTDDTGKDLLKELLDRSTLTTAYAERGFSKPRQQISEEHQIEIRTGEYAIWSEMVDKQEHFIAYGNLVKEMQRMINSKEYMTAVKDKLGMAYYSEIKDWANRVANPNIYKAYDNLEQTISVLRKSVAIGFLGFNLLTVGKQLPSLALFLGDVGPMDLMAGVWDMTTNYKETVEFIHGIAPQMKHRSLERTLEELKQNNKSAYEQLLNEIGKVGMKGIYLMDQVVTHSGWIAIYNKYTAAPFNMSKEKAADKATRAVLRTQPAAHAKDIPGIYAKGAAVSAFLQFTNQINKVYNISTYDIPSYVKSGKYEKAFGAAVGVAISAYLIAAISKGRLPRDKDDLKDALIDSVFTYLIPIIGRGLGAYWRGFGAISLPVIYPYIKAVDVAKSLYKGNYGKALGFAAEATAARIGLPHTAVRKVGVGIKALYTGDTSDWRRLQYSERTLKKGKSKTKKYEARL